MDLDASGGEVVLFIDRQFDVDAAAYSISMGGCTLLDIQASVAGNQLT